MATAEAVSSFGKKLSRLRSMESTSTATSTSTSTSTATATSTSTATATSSETLDSLRLRIAEVLAKKREKRGGSWAARREQEAEDAWREPSSLPFIEEETRFGPLHLVRKSTPIAARFGQAPLYPAVLAEMSMLSLLALDPSLRTCDVRRALYIDTETTGLSGGTGTVPFLIGLGYFDEQRDTFVFEQMFLRKLGEEAPMLDLLATRFAEASMIVTFNGKSFDMPLLRTRMVMNRLGKLDEKPHLDLYHVAKRIHGATLRSCSLRSIEEHVMGHVREGDMPGAEVAMAYLHYVRTGDESGLLGAAEHNMNDVLAMIALLGFYGEPLGALSADALAGVATTLRRAGAFDRAHDVASVSIERGGGSRARRVRGDIEKARGDKTLAIASYEAALAEASSVDDGPLRLELAKLYEHVARAFDKALEVVRGGTSEPTLALEKRRARLERKSARTLVVRTARSKR